MLTSKEEENELGSHFEAKSKYLRLNIPTENTGILLQKNQMGTKTTKNTEDVM